MGLPPGKNGGLSCFPHSVLRVHSAGRSVLADSGKNITRLHWALCGQGLCSEYRCVGALLNANVCGLKCEAQTYGSSGLFMLL